MTWKEWVKEATGADSARQIASKISVSPSSVSTWFRTGKPPASAVVSIARAYGADIVVGLVCAGIMSMEDVESGAEGRMQFVPTRLLLAELSQRGARNTDDLTHGLALEWGD
jgi:hypothetical protein